MATILVVDDEPAMVGMVGALLGDEGYQIVTAYDGEVALRRHAEERPDLVILDRRLPRLSGDEVVRAIRSAASGTPILMLTGEKGSEERARLLDIGADDYLEKPFSKKELSSRVRALLRRAPPHTPAATSTVGRLSIDGSRHRAAVGDKTLDLTPTEFRLLAALAARPGEVAERRSLLRSGWPEERDPDPEWLKAHLARLRTKLEAAGGPTLVNVRGVGYRLE